MNRLAKILAVALVIGLVAAPSAFGKSLQPTLPPDGRAADGNDNAAIALVGGLGVLLLGSALYLSRASSKNATTLRSYSRGRASAPPTWPPTGTSHTALGSPADS